MFICRIGRTVLRAMFVFTFVTLLQVRLLGQCTTCPCPISGFTPLSSNPVTQSLEAGNVSSDGLSQALEDAFFCLSFATTGAGGSIPRPTSIVRTLEYQRHLREVWDKKQALKRMSSRQVTACGALVNEINTEFAHHDIVARPSSGATASSAHHVLGNAIDISLRSSGLPVSQFLNLASGCNLCRPWPVADPVHFEICP